MHCRRVNHYIFLLRARNSICQFCNEGGSKIASASADAGTADVNEDEYTSVGTGAADVNEDKYAGGGSGITGCSSSGGGAGTAGADKDEYAGGSFSAASGFDSCGGAGTAGIDEDEDVDNGFGSTAAGGVGESIGKQLKVGKFKILVAVIHCKRSYLPKKTTATKLF